MQQKEFICIKDLFKGGPFKLFDQFAEDFNIPGAQFSRFLWIRHAICELKKKKKVKKCKCHRLKNCWTKRCLTKLISRLYRTLLVFLDKGKLEAKEKKERNLDKELNV